MWVLGDARIAPDSGVIMEDLIDLKQTWTQKGLCLNDRVWANVTNKVAEAQVLTKRQWAEQEVARLTNARRNGRAYFGLWDNASRQALINRGMMKEHWKETSDAITLATLEAYRDTVRSVSHQLTMRENRHVPEDSQEQEERAAGAASEGAQDAEPHPDSSARNTQGEE